MIGGVSRASGTSLSLVSTNIPARFIGHFRSMLGNNAITTIRTITSPAQIAQLQRIERKLANAIKSDFRDSLSREGTSITLDMFRWTRSKTFWFDRMNKKLNSLVPSVELELIILDRGDNRSKLLITTSEDRYNLQSFNQGIEVKFDSDVGIRRFVLPAQTANQTGVFRTAVFPIAQSTTAIVPHETSGEEITVTRILQEIATIQEEQHKASADNAKKETRMNKVMPLIGSTLGVTTAVVGLTMGAPISSKIASYLLDLGFIHVYTSYDLIMFGYNQSAIAAITILTGVGISASPIIWYSLKNKISSLIAGRKIRQLESKAREQEYVLAGADTEKPKLLGQ